MAEYILKEEVLELLRVSCVKKYPASFSFGLFAAASEIYNSPTADVEEVKHGYWYLLDECANEGVYCSVCHKKVYKKDYANQKVKSEFCPNCGASMDGQRKNDFKVKNSRWLQTLAKVKE